VTTRSSQQTLVEVFREYVYLDEAGKQVTKNAGIMLDVLPNKTAEDQIALDVSSRIVEFVGFAGPKGGGEQPIVPKKVVQPDGTTAEPAGDVKEAEARELTFYSRAVLFSEKIAGSSKEVPTFKERKEKVNVVMTSGQTMVLEMEPRTDEQIVQEVDEAGHVISEKSDVVTRRMIVFLTAYLVDPAFGQRPAPQDAPAPPPTPAKTIPAEVTSPLPR
jgi:hypothetical protein